MSMMSALPVLVGFTSHLCHNLPDPEIPRQHLDNGLRVLIPRSTRKKRATVTPTPKTGVNRVEGNSRFRNKG
jgi:hypothetical protein